MMTSLEEIQSIQSYCSENGITIKQRLHELNIQEAYNISDSAGAISQIPFSIKMTGLQRRNDRLEFGLTARVMLVELI